jgi:hypothetical protein
MLKWPEDHPNTKFLMFVESSRQVIDRAPDGPIAKRADSYCDQIVDLIEQMKPGLTMADVQSRVNQVSLLVNQLVSMMEIVRRSVTAESRKLAPKVV